MTNAVIYARATIQHASLAQKANAITVTLSDVDYAAFMRKRGQQCDIAIVPTAKAKTVSFEYLRKLEVKGVFHQYPILRVMGTDKRYQEYCRELPCEITGEYSEEFKGVGRNIYAHVSDSGRSTGKGKGAGKNKPAYSGMPMRQDVHLLQHSGGWEAVFKKYNIAYDHKNPIRTARQIRDNRLSEWSKRILAIVLGVETVDSASKRRIQEWAANHELGVYFEDN